MRVFLIILLALIIGVTQAQKGPVLPCVDCRSETYRVTPTTGFWYNPEQSGSGLSIEIKKDTAFGAYYGYDQEGKPTWLTFSGKLNPSEKAGVMWELSADLNEFVGGNSFNNDYQTPTLKDSVHKIKIEFNQINHAIPN